MSIVGAYIYILLTNLILEHSIGIYLKNNTHIFRPAGCVKDMFMYATLMFVVKGELLQFQLFVHGVLFVVGSVQRLRRRVVTCDRANAIAILTIRQGGSNVATDPRLTRGSRTGRCTRRCAQRTRIVEAVLVQHELAVLVHIVWIDCLQCLQTSLSIILKQVKRVTHAIHSNTDFGSELTIPRLRQSSRSLSRSVRFRWIIR